MGLTSAGQAQQTVIIDTDAGTIGGSSTTFNGQSFDADVSGTALFTFTEDFVVPDGTQFLGVGQRPARDRKSTRLNSSHYS